MDNSKIKVGIIGFGRMGGKYLDKFLKNGRYEVAYICDVNKEARDYAAKLSPSSTIVADEQIVFEDPKVQVVALCTLANLRKEQIDKAVRYGKHIISEKPVADTVEREWDVVRTTENSNVLSTVNLYPRASTIAACTMSILPVGMLVPSFLHGMPKACACGTIRILGGCSVTARSKTEWCST